MGRQGGELIISLKEKIGLARVMMKKEAFCTAVIIVAHLKDLVVGRKRPKVGNP